MKIINNLKLPFEYPLRKAISIYWKRTKLTLLALLFFLLFYSIFVLSRYIFILNKDFFLYNLDFLIPFGLALGIAALLIQIIPLFIYSSERRAKKKDLFDDNSKISLELLLLILTAPILGLITILSSSQSEITINMKDKVSIIIKKDEDIKTEYN